MKASDFDYELDPRMVAAVPAPRRDESRLCVLDRASGQCEEARFADIGRWLRPGDLLVANNSRVFPARLVGHRRGSGGAIEVLLVEQRSDTEWLCLCRPAKKLKPGQQVVFRDGRLRAEVLEHRGPGERMFRFSWEGEWWALIEEIGSVPLPPYVQSARAHRESLPEDLEEIDRERYQTIYATERGSVAAPTAGMHFTPQLIDSLRAQGIEWTEVTLHVGPGTFLPVTAEDPADHRMHREAFTVGEEAVTAVNAARDEGRRVIPVGSTAVRVLESVCDDGGRVSPGSGSTDLLILPGHRFRAVEAMVTNFHLPRTTLLMLVCAFAGREQTLATYRWAIDREFRLFSYGDAMLIV
jgi:S-adenosylmethionine:tRNA ribosyltransferase-isomerase